MVALRAVEEAGRYKAVLERIFEDFRAGRWVRPEGGGDALVDLEAFLSDFSKKVAAGTGSDVAEVPAIGAAAAAGAQPVRLLVASGGTPWRKRR